MKIFAAFIVLLLSVCSANAQRVIYSEPDKNDFRQTEFEIIGKVGGNILIYKNTRNNYALSVYDFDMKQKERVKLNFLPERIINADFLAYPEYCYMFYQYQKRNVVYAMAAKMDGNGKIVGSPIVMDTTEIGFLASNKIYSVINSEDKEFIGLFKINSKNEENFLLTTSIFNKGLERQDKQFISIRMPERHDYLTEFVIDNEGDFAFVRAVQSQENDKIQKLYFFEKRLGSDQVRAKQVQLNSISLDDVRVKVDNYNKHYIISSFYSKSRRGNIEGLYTCIWDKASDSAKSVIAYEFNENLRNDAKGDNSVKSAFNDFFIRNLIVRKDGGFLLAAESFFSTGRGGNYNRYDYMYGSPFLRPMDYYSFSPYGYGYPWYRYNTLGQSTRYNAQNIAVFSFDSTGTMSWSNVLNKNQYDDETDAFIGYSMLNTGDQLHFLFNQQEKRLQLLNDQSISPTGQVTRNPTLRNLDQGYDFMARYGKQVGARQIIFPCLYRNYLCFARLDL
ncbi:hypothetical protein [Segetibacter sp.]|jgi:hypothetical protein|uniref:hypothetical protein n=1 Tax=Segetibacter sp. TaxID=2231182 RepID=UPI002609C378|nr:hypothetical protein [Segetibacter sp.]MCW3079649.1 hypothetical protein [Segetibacter sp.]